MDIDSISWPCGAVEYKGKFELNHDKVCVAWGQYAQAPAAEIFRQNQHRLQIILMGIVDAVITCVIH